MFPYRTGQYGGAAFLIPYFIFVAILGFSGVVGEMAFGRAMGTGPLGAFGKVMEMRGWKGGRLIGMIPVLRSLAIGIGYSVGGWLVSAVSVGITFREYVPCRGCLRLFWGDSR